MGPSVSKTTLHGRWDGHWVLLRVGVAAGLICGLVVAGAATEAPAGQGRTPELAAPPGLEVLEKSFQQVVSDVAASVVGIRARRRFVSAVPDEDASSGFGMVEQTVVVNGSGTVVRDGGIILTNEHVIRGAWEIEVVLHDGSRHWGAVVAADSRSDLAVLRIAAPALRAARLCEWSSVARGQWSLALGNPFGLGGDGSLSVSVGVIANLNRRLPGLGEVDDRLYADMIQTTAAVHPGNSGGPLFNIHGELIGIVTAVHARGADDEGVGFAIPMTPARRRLIDHLVAGDPIVYGYLGLTVRTLDDDEGREAGLAPGTGVLVERVEPEGPAALGGIQVEDIIVMYGDRRVLAPMQLAEMVGLTPVGHEVVIELRRDGERVVVSARPDARDVDRVKWMRGAALFWRGMRLADLAADAQAGMGVESGVGVVVTDVVSGSVAERAGMQIGQVIERVAGAGVHSTRDFADATCGRTGRVDLRLRGGSIVDVPGEPTGPANRSKTSH